ncbi:hypothetical protein A3H89_05540 [Candidatus Amesbacteria bacterium RIFCSPLOWO2_02_FULL_48_11]|uniref:Uncharacterized protein n=5 Tax=Candidatus Amesiibacteriota TaxID=1752730 RepID=A0A1F4ZA72_9BACT|nr:MAG: hypothetical protein UX78_C0002G0043 [Candidatus Amesbacteria bacterium GW2011_GWA2_47_11]KKU92645.1 MAG: hypothetical protein UY22_C0029G0002 [Candidatus Amesbacteria bacterium GW2011_GWC1_48_10]KKW00825.1 MAG: hypothetical protein UY33_C0004G0011 [Candidatus Amesbacteria bacterium GW2011_GWA1_48_9]OGC96992.1 MAG: hypothetical protein A3C34_00240 [Candidatus Amesbacteria bacterium RIFCSPHIGHO2_02_FULL_48_21]OGD03001.1 MAG: hypothetical protein A3E17_04635 [Candidatus Amesbacteria bacte
MAFSGETDHFIPFRVIRQKNHTWQETLRKWQQRQNGRRKRADIPIGVIINNGHHVPTTSPENLSRLRQIIKRNGR